MKKNIFILVILALVLVFSWAFVSCDDGSTSDNNDSNDYSGRIRGTYTWADGSDSINFTGSNYSRTVYGTICERGTFTVVDDLVDGYRTWKNLQYIVPALADGDDWGMIIYDVNTLWNPYTGAIYKKR